MKKTKTAQSRVHLHRLHEHKDDTRDLAARLAPLEELLSEDTEIVATSGDGLRIVAQDNGAIVVGVAQTDLARELVAAKARNGPFGLEPVVIVIVGLMLAFIVFIAWQISQMSVAQ